MNTHDKLTLSNFIEDLRSVTFREELRGSWATALMCRVPGLGLAWALARLGVPPIAVTMTALAAALSMPLQAVWLPVGVAPLCLLLTGVGFQVMDCADGTLARATGRTSQTGADLDFLIDMAQWGLLYLALGLLADRVLGGGHGWAVLGACAAWARLLARVVRDRLDDGVKPASKPMTLFDYPVAFISGISGLIPFIAISGQWIGLWIIALMVYSLIDIAEGLLPLAQRK